MAWTHPKPTSIFTSSPPRTLLFFLSLFILFIFTFLHHHSTSTGTATATVNFQNTFLLAASNYTLSTYLHSLTLHPHLAGTPSSIPTSNYVFSHFQSLSLPTHVNRHSVLLSYPLHSSLSAHFPNSTSSTIPLSEPSGSNRVRDGVVKPYHAYSPSGSAYGKAVYVHHGRDQDYVTLAELGVDVNGCIAIVKRGGGLSRNAAVEKAAEKGVAAVLMYTDADGNEGYRNGVERGTVMKDLGDPQTPGWAGGERIGLEESEVVKKFPTVASMPISAETADAILGTLEGPRVPFAWREYNGLKGKFERIGPGPTLLNFTYQGENKVATIRNVFAVIKGSEEPDRVVMLGNHRDAWTYGAVDPNSGTAALLDIARRYALLMRLGWNPRRTIVLCSWDAEEFGMIGSTEWVEQNLVNLGLKAIAYLNVDCAVQGPGFFASATPQLDDLLVEITKKVRDPDLPDLTLFENWIASNQGILIQRLSRVDSDFAPFLQHAGIPSVDLYYGRDFPVYHTAFDSYNWMINSGDPLFHRHVAITGVWGLLALHLADDPILPFNYLSYAAQLQNYMDVLTNFVEGDVSLHPIASAIQELRAAAVRVEEEVKILREQQTMGDVSMLKRRMLNDRLMSAERGFLDAEGLQGRQWFKHLVYGPSHSDNEILQFFPGIINAISQSTRTNQTERKAEILHEIWRVARAIQRAAYALKGELT